MPTGIVKMWKGEKGFGFVKPDIEGPDVFLHASQMPGEDRRKHAEVGDRVSYDLEHDSQDRPQAKNVEFI